MAAFNYDKHDKWLDETTLNILLSFVIQKHKKTLVPCVAYYSNLVVPVSVFLFFTECLAIVTGMAVGRTYMYGQ